MQVGTEISGYHFGASHFFSGGAPKTGKLAEVLDACQHSVWKTTRSGAGIAGGDVEMELEKGKVRVVVTDQELIKNLFLGKPRTVASSYE